MSSKIRILKVKRLSCGRDTMDGIRDGELFILTNLRRFKVKDTAADTDSIS
jgi:hypothetical protein